MSWLMKKNFLINFSDADDFETYENVRKIATGKGYHDYTTGCLLDYLISKKIIKWLQ